MNQKKPSIVGRPQKEEGTSAAVDWITQGLDRPSQKQSGEKEAQVKLRLTREKVEEIDALRKSRRVKVSRHVWFLEAIEEKIQRENEMLK